MRAGLIGGAMLLTLAACATPQRPATAPPPAAPPPPTLDASYDWHVLLVAPFGSVVKAVPLKLHEVLLFKERAAESADTGECYASDQTPPTFLKRTPSQLVLCFKHDHLSRIEAVVMLPREQAAEIMTSACALWHQQAGQGAGNAALPCAGSDGSVHYEAHPDEEAAEGEEVALAVKLEQAAPGAS